MITGRTFFIAVLVSAALFAGARDSCAQTERSPEEVTRILSAAVAYLEREIGEGAVVFGVQGLKSDSRADAPDEAIRAVAAARRTGRSAVAREAVTCVPDGLRRHCRIPEGFDAAVHMSGPETRSDGSVAVWVAVYSNSGEHQVSWLEVRLRLARSQEGWRVVEELERWIAN